MKNKRGYFIFTLLLTSFLLFSSNKRDIFANSMTKSSITLNQSKKILGLNETYKRTASVSDKNDQTVITYSSSNPKIATVSSDGTVTGKSRGSVTITASLSSDETINASYPIKVIRKYKKNELFFIAHRGYSQIAPENSIPAFTAAGKAGFSAAECDIYETAKDKRGKRRFIIMHDSTLNRMCQIKGRKIRQTSLTYQTFRSKYHLKSGANVSKYSKKELRIPTLEEYLSICKKYRMTPVVEIKQELNNSSVKRLYICIRKARLQNKAIIISRHKSSLTYMRKCSSKISLQYVCDNVYKSQYNWLKKYHINLCLNKKALSSLSSSLKKNKFTINAWTLKNQEEVSDYAAEGARSITSNMILWKQ